MTIKDVAKRAGVSIATVSRVLNNPSKVSADKRRRVQEAIKDLNFKPNAFARSLAGGDTNTIGLIIPGYEGMFHSFYATEIIKYIGSEVERLKKDLFIHIFRGKDNFDPNKVDAVIFSDIINNNSQLTRLIESGLFCVVINNRAQGVEVNSVYTDNKKASQEVVQYLYDCGHRKIAHITGDLKTECANMRLDGFKEGISQLNLTLPSEYIQVGDFSRASARRSIEKLFKLNEIPTAVFCSSDDMAEEVIKFVIEKNLKVPENISVVGFDDNPNYLYGPIGITTVSQPLSLMVKEAVKMIEDYFSEGKSEIIKKEIPSKIIIKDSVSHIS